MTSAFLQISAFIVDDVIKLLKWEYILTGMCYIRKILHVECSNCPLCTEIIIFPKWRTNLMISAFLKNCWCQQKLKLEYLLIGICYCLEILHGEGPGYTLYTKVKIFPKWRIYVVTSSFFEKFKKWWRHQKFRHYGKNKICNLKKFIITKIVESFISVTFIYDE